MLILIPIASAAAISLIAGAAFNIWIEVQGPRIARTARRRSR